MKKLLSGLLFALTACCLHGSSLEMDEGERRLAEEIGCLLELEEAASVSGERVVRGILNNHRSLDVNQFCKRPALIAALSAELPSECIERKVRTVRKLIKQGADLETPYNGLFPLHWAILKGYDVGVVHELLKNEKCDPHSLTVYGLTPLALFLLKTALTAGSEVAYPIAHLFVEKHKARFSSPAFPLERRKELLALINECSFTDLFTEKQTGTVCLEDEKEFPFFLKKSDDSKIQMKTISYEQYEQLVEMYKKHTDLVNGERVLC